MVIFFVINVENKGIVLLVSIDIVSIIAYTASNYRLLQEFDLQEEKPRVSYPCDLGIREKRRSKAFYCVIDRFNSQK